METGLYTITAPNGNFYLGSTTRSFKRRWQEHRSELKHKRHKNPVLQAAWDKYGAENMIFAVLLRCPPEDCEREELKALKEMPHTYNLALDTKSPFKGRKHTDEAKEKCRKIHLGRKKPPLSDERKAMISAFFKGKKLPPRSEEYKEKQRIAQSGKTLSESHKRAISIAGKGLKRKPRTDAHKKAISESKKGKKLGADNHVSRKVRCIETNMIFDTLRAAANWVKEKNPLAVPSNISSCCRGKLKSIYGYTWQYVD